jgi:XTP/dITP diphosphohydrolase
MTDSRILVLGTHNPKKRQELERLLAPCGFHLLTLSDFDNALDVEETGTTFAENAMLKATKQAEHLSRWVLGEDSGLSVRALEGAPGIHSARYSGPAATDEKNNKQLLEQLGDLEFQHREAHYTCHMAVSDPQGIIRASSEAECHGRIRPQEAGSNGFGYDPLFEILEYHLTFGQLGPGVKSVLSHRSRATRRLVPQLLALRKQWNDSN